MPLDEENETFRLVVQLVSDIPGHVTLPGPLTITDDDEPPSVSVTDGEADEDAGRVTLSSAERGERQDGEGHVRDLDGDGRHRGGGTDYMAVPAATLTFARGETEKTVWVLVSNDGDLEPDETFTVTLSLPANANATLGDATATGRIRKRRPPGGLQHMSWLEMAYRCEDPSLVSQMCRGPLGGSSRGRRREADVAWRGLPVSEPSRLRPPLERLGSRVGREWRGFSDRLDAAANKIHISHPRASRASSGCSRRSRSLLLRWTPLGVGGLPRHWRSEKDGLLGTIRDRFDGTVRARELGQMAPGKCR